MRVTHLPAAKILLMLPPLTSMAVTGPGRSEPEPSADHVELPILYRMTLDGLLSDNAMEPAAIKVSS